VQSVECLTIASDGAVCLTIVESARYVPNGNRHLQEFILRAHTSVVFKKVDGQVNIFGGNGQTGQEHISKDESIRHLSTIYCYQHRSVLQAVSCCCAHSHCPSLCCFPDPSPFPLLAFTNESVPNFIPIW
jgi:hypothetical protein